MLKAVAVPYIITLILGVTVIGLVGYWLISSGGKLFSQSSSLECDSQKLTFCQGGGWNSNCGAEPNCNQLFGFSRPSSSSSSSESGATFVHRTDIDEPPSLGG